MAKDVTRRCHACGYALTLDSETWEKVETAGGRRFPAKHSCGGTYVAEVARLGRAS